MCRSIALAAGLWLALLPSRALAVEDEAPEEAFGDEWLWIDARGGYQFVDLLTFENGHEVYDNSLLGESTGGPAASFGVGARLVFVTLGPRLRFARMIAGERDFSLWSLDAELGFRVPLGRFEPHLTLAGGYSGAGDLEDVLDDIGKTYSASGLNVRTGLGLDVFVTEMVSLGADVSGEVLMLSRKDVPLNEVFAAYGDQSIRQEVREVDGTSTGASVTVLAGVGLHF